MKDVSGKLFVVYSIPEHCGHEVTYRIFSSLKDARNYVDPLNKIHSENFSFWDGSSYAALIKTKIMKDGKILDWEGCDICQTVFTCKCIGDSPRKTEEAYNAYWTPERRFHVTEHFHKAIKENNCKFCIDPEDNYTMINA